MKILKKLLPLLLILGIACTFFACKEDDTTDGNQDGIQDGTQDGTQDGSQDNNQDNNQDNGQNNTQGGSANYTVTFDYNYEGAPSAVTSTVKHNDRASKPSEDPTRAGYDFTGWYVDSACMIEQTFLSSGVTNSPVSKVTADTTFYAGWVEHVEIPELVSINANYLGSGVELNSNLNSAHITVTATYDDNTSKAVSGFTVSEIDTTTAGIKTVTVTYTEGEITKTVDITVEVIDNTIPETTAVTLYFKSENGWTNAYIYSWEGSNGILGAWPGVVMTSEGNGWFSYTFAEGVTPTNVIFNNGESEGTQKTTDLLYDGINNYYAFNTMSGGVWGADNTVSAPVVESDCYLRGNVASGQTDWTVGTAMTYNGTDEYSITVTVDAGAEVKVVYQGNWIGTELLKDGITVAIEKPAGGNIKFTNAGTYTIYYKVSGDVGIWIEVAA